MKYDDLWNGRSKFKYFDIIEWGNLTKYNAYNFYGKKEFSCKNKSILIIAKNNQ